VVRDGFFFHWVVHITGIRVVLVVGRLVVALPVVLARLRFFRMEFEVASSASDSDSPWSYQLGFRP